MASLSHPPTFKKPASVKFARGTSLILTPEKIFEGRQGIQPWSERARGSPETGTNSRSKIQSKENLSVGDKLEKGPSIPLGNKRITVEKNKN